MLAGNEPLAKKRCASVDSKSWMPGKAYVDKIAGVLRGVEQRQSSDKKAKNHGQFYLSGLSLNMRPSHYHLFVKREVQHVLPMGCLSPQPNPSRY